jgi:PAS domain S-box-containing protein
MAKKIPSATSELKPKTGNPPPLRVLMIEDSEDDALLIIRALKKGCYTPEYERVETAADMRKALQDKTWDIILSDYKMPHFSGPKALALLQKTNMDIPLIIISGTIGEETAVECMRLGAHDYLIKGNLTRLCAAIDRELAEARSRSERRLAEQAVILSELRFKELFENMSSCVAVYEAVADGTDFVFKDFNRAAEIAEKVERKKLLGKSVLQVFPGVREMGLLEVLQRVWKTGRPEHYSANFYKDKRIEGWRENYVYKLPTGEVVALYNDITERIKAERRIFESEEKYRLLVENSSESIFIAQDAMLKFANRASVALFGSPYEVLTSVPFVEFIHPEDRELVLGSHLRRLRGETVRPVYAFRLLTQEGIIKWVEIHAAIISWQGKPATLNFLTDITERKRLDELLKNSEQQYRTFINATTDMVFVKDEQLRHIIANQALAVFFGKDQTDIIGKTDFELMPEQAALNCQSSDRQAIRTQSLVITEQQVGGRLYEMTKFPVPLQSDKNGVGGIIRDVTERKQAEEKLALNFETQAALNALLVLSLEGRPIQDYLYSVLDLVLALKWLAIEAKGAIFLADKAGETLQLLAHKGFSKELCTLCKTVPFGHCLCGRAAATQAIQFADCVDQRHETSYEGMPPHGHYCVPILSSDHVLGVIVLYVKEGHIRSSWEEDFLKAVANSLAGTVERRQAEEALKKSESKYRLLADNVNDVIFVLDTKLNYTYISPSVKILRGFEPAEVLKQSVKDTLTPASWDLAMTALSESIELEKSAHGEIPLSRTLQLEMRRKDGTTLWTEVTFSVIRDENKQPLSILGLTRDITERKRAEEKLRESEKKYRDLYDFLPIPVYEMDFEANITAANRAIYETFRATEEDFQRGFKGWELLSPEEVDKSAKNIQRLLKGEQVAGTEYTLRRLDGSFFSAIVISSVIYSDGKPTGLRGAIIDITERKQAEEALRLNNASLRTINMISDAVYQSLDFYTVVKKAAQAMDEFFNTPSVSVFMIDEKQQCLEQVFASNPDLEAARLIPTLPLSGGSITAMTVKSRDVVVCEDVARDEIMRPDVKQAILKWGRQTILSLPLLFQDQVLGAMNLFFQEKRTFTTSERETFLSVGKTIGLAMANARHVSQIEAEIKERKQAEEKLRKSEQQQKIITENISDTVWLMDVNFRTTWISPSVMKTQGYTPEEFTKIPLEKQLTPESFQFAQQLMREHLTAENLADKNRGRIVDGEFECYRKDGTTFWAEVNISLLRDTAGKPAGFLGISRDITKRRQMEEALQETQKLLQDAYSLAEIGSFSWNLDDRTIIWSEELCRMAGLNSQQRKFPDTKHPRIYTPKSWELLNKTINNSLKTGESFHVELEITHPDGSNRWLNWIGGVIYDHNKKITGMHGTAQDITERKAAEDKLKKYAAEIADLYNSAPCGYHSRAADDTFSRINDTELKWLGYERDEIIGKKKLSEILTPDGRTIFQNAFPLLKKQGWIKDLEFDMIRKDGSVFPVLLNSTALRDKEGNFIESRATIFDMTELKKARLELEKSNRELVAADEELREKQAMIIQQEKMASIGVLSAGVAHEIKNPLAIMLQGINYLQSTLTGNPLMTEVVARLHNAVLRADVIVKGLLSYARQDSLALDKQDILKVIDESLALTEHELHKKNLRLIKQYEPDLPMVSVDGNQIKQVFINVLLNGIDAMSPGGTLTINAGQIADNEGKNLLAITFKDTGQGIPADKINNIFDPFYTTKAIGNTGLGLSISRGIIDRHGGTIHAESKIGQGTSIIIKLPIPL